MKFLKKGKDGGKESHVWGYWLIEAKSLFSIAILRFDPGTREAYHNHAFNCISWVLKGKLEEQHLQDNKVEFHTPGLKPIITKRNTFHKVFSHGTTWVFTIRGPWSDKWKENVNGQEITLTHGRQIIS
jgi:predicted metal-dependent enzyme (double-stranded beta helix superfamily)